MKIRFLGFKWDLECTSIGMLDLCSHIQEGEQRNIKKVVRNLASKTHDDMPLLIAPLIQRGEWWTGVSIKIKDVRAFCKMVEDSGSVKLISQRMGDNETAVEVNFFIVNEESGCGLYQYHHQSTCLNSFCKHCKFRYDELIKKQREELIKSGASKKEIAKFAAEKSLSYEILATKEKLPILVRQLERVKKLEIVALEHMIKDSDPFAPIADSVERVQHRFIVGKKHLEGFQNTVATALEKAHLKSARVEGINADNLEVVYKLEDNYQSFGELDYDDAIRFLDFDIKDVTKSLQNSPMLDKMLKIVGQEENKKIFEK